MATSATSRLAALAARLAPSALLSDKKQDVHQPPHILTRWRSGILKARRISKKGQGLIKVCAEPSALKAALQAYPAPAPIAHSKAHLDLVDAYSQWKNEVLEPCDALLKGGREAFFKPRHISTHALALPRRTSTRWRCGILKPLKKRRISKKRPGFTAAWYRSLRSQFGIAA